MGEFLALFLGFLLSAICFFACCGFLICWVELNEKEMD